MKNKDIAPNQTAVKVFGFIKKNYIILILSIFFMISLGIIVSKNIETKNVTNFERYYEDILIYDVERIMNEVPKQVNYVNEDNTFYLPGEYKRVNQEGLIFTNNKGLIEIYFSNGKFPEDFANTINQKYEMIYSGIVQGDNDTKLYVWDYKPGFKKILMLKNNIYISADVNDKNVEEITNEMAYILNSVKGSSNDSK